MELSLSDIKKRLWTLSSKEKKDLLVTLNFLVSKDKNKDKEEDWLLDGIISELHWRGFYVISGFTIKNSGSYAAFTTKSKVVRDLLENCIPNLTDTEKKLLGQTAAYELARYISNPYYSKELGKEIIRDITLDSMLRYVHLVPNAIDKSYPGYMASGMLGVIVRRISK